VKVLLTFLVFTLVISFLSPAHAENTYIDFEFPSKLLLTNYEYKINFHYLLANAKEDDFIVTPILENGTAEIFDKIKNIWIKQNSMRSNFPKLSAVMEFRITSFGNAKTKICFELQHLKTGIICKSPCKTYWNRGYFARYVNAINDRILKWEKGN
jgi:hypothetical protein